MAYFTMIPIFYFTGIFPANIFSTFVPFGVGFMIIAFSNLTIFSLHRPFSSFCSVALLQYELPTRDLNFVHCRWFSYWCKSDIKYCRTLVEAIVWLQLWLYASWPSCQYCLLQVWICCNMI